MENQKVQRHSCDYGDIIRWYMLQKYSSNSSLEFHKWFYFLVCLNSLWRFFASHVAFGFFETFRSQLHTACMLDECVVRWFENATCQVVGYDCEFQNLTNREWLSIDFTNAVRAKSPNPIPAVHDVNTHSCSHARTFKSRSLRNMSTLVMRSRSRMSDISCTTRVQDLVTTTHQAHSTTPTFILTRPRWTPSSLSFAWAAARYSFVWMEGVAWDSGGGVHGRGWWRL